MNCAKLETLLAMAIDQPLDARRQASIDEHLATCAACGELRVSLLATRRAAAALRECETDDAVAARVRGAVLATIASAAPASQPWRRLTDWIAAVATGRGSRRAGPRIAFAGAALLIAVAALLIFRERPTAPIVEQSPPQEPSSPPAAAGVLHPLTPVPTSAPDLTVSQTAAEGRPPEAQHPLSVQPRAVQRPRPGLQSTRQAVIKIVTDDPGVVIYWIVEEKEA